MKKLLIIVTLSIVLFFTSQAQGLHSITMGMGISNFHIKTYSSSNIGVNFNFSVDQIYMDLSSNCAKGEGEYLDFTSTYTRQADKLNIGVCNIGYIITMKKVSIIPIVGYGWSRKIYQDPIGWDTYCYGKSSGHFNIGVVGNLQLSKVINLHIGIGTYERLKAGLAYQFIN